MIHKNTLRKQLLAERKSLSLETRKTFSELICKDALNLSHVQDARVVFVYVSMGSEVETPGLISELFALGKRVLVPRMIGDEMHACELDSPDDLEGGTLCDIDPDVSICPGVGFSKEGYRLGRGQGHYDRWLAKHDCFKIGICFDCQIADVPVEEHDVAMDIVLTNLEKYRVK